MGFGNRKLMDESLIPSINSTMSTQTTNGTLSEFCEPSCDPLVNGSGYCISPCLNVCPTNCRYAISPPEYPLLSDYYPPTPPPPPPPPVMRVFSKHHVPPLLITAFVALSLAVLIVLGYVIYIRIYGRRGNRGGRDIAQPQRALPPQDDGFLDDLEPALDHPIWYIRTVGLEPSVISKISLCKYKRGEGLIEGTDCSVCLTEFEEDETLRLLPKCSHAFHVPCIDTWLRSHTSCPNCRAPIVTGTGRSPSPELSNNWEEIRLDEGTGDADLGREVESTPQSRGETEEETEELSANRSQDTVDESKNELQPIRRLVSVDSSSAAKISLAVADFLMAKPAGTSDPEPGDEENQDPRSKRFADSSNPSLGRSVQKLTGSSSSVNRSLSWSGRFLASKYSRNQSSLLPL